MSSDMCCDCDVMLSAQLCLKREESCMYVNSMYIVLGSGACST